jgi:uncharacterized membrane protein
MSWFSPTPKIDHDQVVAALQAAEAMGSRFRSGDFTDGVVHGITRAGELLARTFPRTPADRPPPSPEATEVD